MVSATTAGQPREQKQFVANLKPGGKMHKLTPSNVEGRFEYRRAICGWKAGRAIAKAQFCYKILSGSKCLKCFPGSDQKKEATSHNCEDAVEVCD